jgi:apolipoprotein N-acyltransferase
MSWILQAIATFLLALTQPPVNLSGLVGFIGLVVIFRITQKQRDMRQALLRGLFSGLLYFGLVLSWMDVVGKDAWFALALICAFWWMVAFAGMSWAHREGFNAFIASAFFVVAENLRDTIPWGGFGWAPLSLLIVDTPWQGLLRLTGSLLAMWILVASAWFLAEAWSQPRRLVSALSVAIVSAVVLSVSGLGVISPQSTRSISIAAVQGGVDRTGLGVVGDPRTVLLRHARQTLADQQKLQNADVVVWPENAADVDPTLDQYSANVITQVSQITNKPILLGAVTRELNNRVGNVSLIWEGETWKRVYQKRRLVPFGEFMPLRDIISRITDRAALMPRDFAPGNESGSLTINQINVGVVICFEVADNRIGLPAHDQSVLVVHTNNATYQYLGQSEQQLEQARARSIESSRPVIVISTSGISASVDAEGAVTDSLSQDQVGTLIADVPQRLGSTPAMLIAPWSGWLILLPLVYALVRAFRRRFKVQA